MALEPTSTQAPPWPEPLVLILALSAWEAAASWKRPLAASPTLRLKSTWSGLLRPRMMPGLNTHRWHIRPSLYPNRVKRVYN